MQKRPKRCCPGVRAQLLVGELDLNGLIGAFELNSLAHRLVSRAFAHTWLVFLHKNNQPTNGGLNSTALLRLRRWVSVQRWRWRGFWSLMTNRASSPRLSRH